MDIVTKYRALRMIKNKTLEIRYIKQKVSLEKNNEEKQKLKTLLERKVFWLDNFKDVLNGFVDNNSI